MKLYPFKATLPNLDLIPSPDAFFSSIKNDYHDNKLSGFFKPKGSLCIFIQKITTNYGQHYGIIANNALHDLENGKILKHEKTLNAKEQSMLSFLLHAKAMVKPILLAYPEVEDITEFIQKYVKENPIEITVNFEDGTKHDYWTISKSKQIQKVQSLFEKNVSKCYIADGHHRCATMIKLMDNEYLAKEGIVIDQILSAYYSFDNLKILDYNRIVDLQGEISPLKLMAKLSKYCDIKPLSSKAKPTEVYRFHLFLEEEWYELTWHDKVIKKHADEKLLLDSSLVNYYIFGKILKIKDVRTDPRITYSEGVLPLKKVIKALKKDKDKIGIFLPPMSIEDIKVAAEHDISLPPKSTWFEPRIKSGLVISEF